MAEPSQGETVERLHRSRTDLIEALEPDALATFVNEQTGRRGIDVAWHVAQWEHLVAGAMESHALGGANPVISPFDVHAINEAIFQLHRGRTEEALRPFLDASRRAFLFILDRIDPNERVLLPWGRRESTIEIATDMLKHERHHTQQIKAACRRA